MATTDILPEQAQGVQETAVELTIQTVSGNCHSVSAFSSWSVRGVKEAVSGLTNHSVNQQRLLFGTRVLSDSEILLKFLPPSQTHHEMLLVISIDEEQANIITSLVLGRIDLRNVDRKHQEDLYVVEAAVRRNGMNLEHAHGAALKDKTIVFAAVVQNGFALSFAPREFSSEADVVIAAVRSNAFSITLADQSLQTDCDFAIKAVQANPFVRDYLERCILDNVEFRRAFAPTAVNHSMGQRGSRENVRLPPISSMVLLEARQEMEKAAEKTPLRHETKKAAASKKSVCANPIRANPVLHRDRTPPTMATTDILLEQAQGVQETAVELTKTPLRHETKKAAASKKCNLLRLLCCCTSTHQQQHKAARSNMR